MESRTAAFIRRLKEWLAEPTADHLINLLQSAADAVGAPAGDAPPADLISALRGTPGQISVVTLRIADATVSAAVTPRGSTGADAEARVWASIQECVTRWSARPGHRAHRVQRETLAPEIGALRITTAAGAIITVINSAVPHSAAVALLRALKARVLLPAAAAGNAAQQWAARKSREHPVIAGVAAAAVGLTAVLSGLTGDEPGEHRDPPAVWAPTSAGTTHPEVSATSTPGTGARPEPPGAPLERSNHGGHLGGQTTTPTSRPATTPTTTPAPARREPGTLRGGTASPPPARPTPQPSGQPSPTPDTDQSTDQTGENSPPGDGCDGILGVGATADPLLGIDVCIG